MEPRADFEAFCAKHNIEPTDDRFVCWVGALHLLWTTAVPVAWAPLDSDGVPLAVLSAIDPTRQHTVQPLFAAPIPNIQKPALDRRSAEMVLRNYDGDAEGVALFYHRYYSTR